MKLALLLLAVTCSAKTFYLTVGGLGGEPDYEQRFAGLVAEAEKSEREPGGDSDIQSLSGPKATRANLHAALDRIAHEATARDTLVLLLIGHGSFDGVDYKFNIPGPDISATELAEALNRVPAGRQLVVNTTSASGGALKALQHAGRIVVSATRNGGESNATVYARFWIEALHDRAADVDKDDTVSALEAFQYAQRKTAKFYEEQKRLATEHALIDDSAHAASFPVIRFGSAAAAASDPAKRVLIDKRDEIEARIDVLKMQKNALPPDTYKKQLTALLLELARAQQEIDK